MATKTQAWAAEGFFGGAWLVVARMGAAALMAVLVLVLREQARYPELLHLATGAAAVGATATWAAGDRRAWNVVLFVADILWIALAVIATGRVDTGLTLLFPLVAFGAGLCLGGRVALALSLLAGSALVLSVAAVPGTGMGPGWVTVQGVLVLVLGGVTDRTRSVMQSREHALEFATHALEGMRMDSESVVQHLGSALLTVDREGRVVHVNHQAERTLGIRAATVRGRLVSEALPAGATELARALELGLRGTAERRAEVELHRDGVTMPLGLGITVLAHPDGEVTGVVALFQDLTEVRRQEQLRRRRDRLAAVGELAAGMAHEIRNSVLPIGGSVQILAGEVVVNEEQRRLFEVIERETENVERFVSALLNYTRSERPRLGRVDLVEVLQDTVETLRVSRKPEPQVRIEGQSTLAAADADQIRQVVRNLAMNAADAVEMQGQITLRCGTDAQGRPWMEVEDDGPGVPLQDRERVVQPFFTSKPGGTGLGLAIVSRIVEDHEGTLEILDGTSGGARFRVTLSPYAESFESVAA